MTEDAWQPDNPLTWPDAEQEALADLRGFPALLKDCVVDKSYRVSDDWISRIKLTAAGNGLVQQLLDKRVKPNEARLAVFMAFNTPTECLVDLTTDPDALRAVLSDEILGGKIRYPYVLGRELMDTAFDRFVGKSRLDEKRTKALLAELPVGVFQRGRTVVGPLGAYRRRDLRGLRPHRVVPGYYCGETHCRQLHGLELSTGKTSISRANEKLRSILHAQYPEEGAWKSNVFRLPRIRYGVTSDTTSNDLFHLISDALLDDELRAVVDHLIRRFCKEPDARTDMGRQWRVMITDPSDTVQHRSRAELEHMIRYFPNRAIERALDDLTLRRTIKVGPYETRRSKFPRWDTGAYRLDAELGPQGLRYVGINFITRLLRLLRSLYLEEGAVLEAADLAFALDVEEPTAQDALQDFVMREDPAEVLDTLVLANRKASIQAAAALELTQEQVKNRAALRQALLWKLGAPTSFEDMATSSTSELSLSLEKLASSSSPTEHDLRGSASNLFVALESYLQRSLVFCTWALTTDHYMQDRPYYFDFNKTPDVLSWIEDSLPETDPSLRLSPRGKNNLVPLASGFSRLAAALEDLDPQAHYREPRDYPLESQETGRSFAFRHTIPFLDLSPPVAAHMLDSLREAGRLAQSPVIVKVRNALVHGNTKFPEASDMAEAARRCRECISHLARTGMGAVLYRLVRHEADEAGRELVVLRTEHDVVELRSPWVSLAPRLPFHARQQLVIPGAVVADVGPLRFIPYGSSPRDHYWAGWPRRWPRKETQPVPEPQYSEAEVS